MRRCYKIVSMDELSDCTDEPDKFVCEKNQCKKTEGMQRETRFVKGMNCLINVMNKAFHHLQIKSAHSSLNMHRKSILTI